MAFIVRLKYTNWKELKQQICPIGKKASRVGICVTRTKCWDAKSATHGDGNSKRSAHRIDSIRPSSATDMPLHKRTPFLNRARSSFYWEPARHLVELAKEKFFPEQIVVSLTIVFFIHQSTVHHDSYLFSLIFAEFLIPIINQLTLLLLFFLVFTFGAFGPEMSLGVVVVVAFARRHNRSQLRMEITWFSPTVCRLSHFPHTPSQSSDRTTRACGQDATTLHRPNRDRPLRLANNIRLYLPKHARPDCIIKESFSFDDKLRPIDTSVELITSCSIINDNFAIPCIKNIILNYCKRNYFIDYSNFDW